MRIFLRLLKTGLAVLTGLVLAGLLFQRPMFLAAASKLVGKDEPCPWGPLLRYPWALEAFANSQEEEQKATKVVREDAALGIQLIQTTSRPFWIKKDGEEMNGQNLLAFVMAEQKWIAGQVPEYAVKPGDVVLDVGAHVGTFDDNALIRGAAKCILVEPDPVNVEAIRRNFAKEIAEGKIIVVPEGAWSSPSTLKFALGVSNSGMGSFVLSEEGAKMIEVPVRPLDDILAGLGIDHVDYIKMDIEGAEREALKGAKNTLRRDKPVIMIDAYHRDDDPVVLPKVIHDGNELYTSSCSLCSPERTGSSNRFVPYVLFFH